MRPKESAVLIRLFICTLPILLRGTFRYVPVDLDAGDEKTEPYLDQLNRELLTRLQAGGEAYVSNAVVHGRFALRACIVNFRTSLADVEALLPIVVRIGGEVDAELRTEAVRSEASLGAQ